MPIDPYTVLRALLRAEAARSTPRTPSPKAKAKESQPQQPPKDPGR